MLKDLSPRTKFCVVFFVTMCLGAPYFLYATHPKYSFVGDEWGFFALSNAVIDSRFLKNPLGGGVFTVNPMLPQMIQAFFMMLLGGDVWGWKVASLMPVVFSALLLFIWSRLWFDELTAMSMALILAASSYLWNFSLIGYINQFGVAHLLLLHVLISKLVKCNDARIALWSAPLVGIVAGLSFFEYGGIAFPVILLPYSIFLAPRTRTHALRLPFLVVILVGMLTATPGLLDPTYRDGLFTQASLPNHPLTNSDRINNSLGYLLSFMWMSKASHYAYGPYVDAVSRIGVVLGALVCVFLIGRRPRSTEAHDRRAGFFLVLSCTILTAFTYGFSSPYPEPPRTRGIFMVPHFAMLAGVGFGSIAHVLGSRSRLVFLSLLFGSIVTLNQIRRHQFFTRVGITPEACVIWMAQRARAASSTASEVYIHLEDSDVIPGHEWHLHLTVETANTLFSRYLDKPFKAIELAKGEKPPKMSDFAINLSEIFRDRCTNLVIQELPGFARGRSDTDRGW